MMINQFIPEEVKIKFFEFDQIYEKTKIIRLEQNYNLLKTFCLLHLI